LENIRELGKEENYTVNRTQAKASMEVPPKKVEWELCRVISSGVALTIAFIMGKLGLPAFVFIPIYLVAMVSGGWGNFRKAAVALPRRNFNMSVLMSVAILGAVLIGKYEEGATVAFLYDIGDAGSLDYG
jgi:Cd2+/Zn2+-exporting ATPase